MLNFCPKAKSDSATPIGEIEPLLDTNLLESVATDSVTKTLGNEERPGGSSLLEISSAASSFLSEVLAGSALVELMATWFLQDQFSFLADAAEQLASYPACQAGLKVCRFYCTLIDVR